MRTGPDFSRTLLLIKSGDERKRAPYNATQSSTPGDSGRAVLILSRSQAQNPVLHDCPGKSTHTQPQATL